MAASTGIRSTLFRTLFRKTRFSTSSSSSSSASSSPFSLPRTRISPSSSSPPSSSPPSSFRLRRELRSLQPVHSAVASACLVSRLPDRPTAATECRFANYVSPI